jgi:radical SAM superfamily enzyme YgiQ (UPF0313 family)
VLVNTNEIRPPVAPIALDYLAGALCEEGYRAEVLDLNLAADASEALCACFAAGSVEAVGVTFRNSDDCFWPSAASFVPRLVEIVRSIRILTDAPVVLGGCGFSLFPRPILQACGCDYGIRGDGERALIMLLRALKRGAGMDRVPGLAWRSAGDGGEEFRFNPPDSPAPVRLSGLRQWVDNPRYFREGGQGNVETKRGCDQPCTYCADPLVKGRHVRLRDPAEVAGEVESLLAQGVDVLHLCDSEFNIPPCHALAVCAELDRRGLGRRLRWYTYASVVPFTEELAGAMRRPGCAGINFGTDSASAEILSAYGRVHRRDDIASAVALCRRHGLRVMIDLLLGGPGETERTVRETIEFLKAVGPDCVGAALGVRIYPGTAIAARVAAEGAPDANPNLWRRKTSALPPAPGEDLLAPVFYISRGLGDRPAQLVRDVIGGDERFFAPVVEQTLENYNYNANQALIEAIRRGARGAYWDILRQMRSGSA